MITDFNLISDFTDNIEYPNEPDGCWLWAGSVNSYGYGVFYSYHNLTSTYLAHRISWQVFKAEPLADGLVLDHFKCYCRHCVNPKHLRQTTISNNSKNKSPEGLAEIRKISKRKCELAVGETNAASKLSNEQLLAILQLKTSGRSQKSVAEEFGCCRENIRRIWRKPKEFYNFLLIKS